MSVSRLMLPRRKLKMHADKRTYHRVNSDANSSVADTNFDRMAMPHPRRLLIDAIQYITVRTGWTIRFASQSRYSLLRAPWDCLGRQALPRLAEA